MEQIVLDLSKYSSISIGSHSQCEVLLRREGVSYIHAILINEKGNYLIRDNESLNGTYVNGERINNTLYLLEGDEIQIGDIIFHLENGILSSEEFSQGMEPQEDIYWFKRTLRLKKELPKDKILVDYPKAFDTTNKADWYDILSSPTVGVASMVISQIADKLDRAEKEYAEKYIEYLKNIEQQIGRLKEQQLLAMQMDNPAVKNCLSIVKDKDVRLWSRRVEDADFLNVRVGYGECETSFEVKGSKDGFVMGENVLLKSAQEIINGAQMVEGAPICCNVLKQRLLGVIGEKKSAIKLVKNMIVQVSTLHDYEEVKIVPIYAPEEKADWAWVKWLPHYPLEREEDVLLTELAQLLEKWQHLNEEDGVPYFIFVVTDLKLIEDHPILQYFLQKKTELQLGVIFISEDMYQLPTECNWIIETAKERGMMFPTENISAKQYFQIEELGEYEYGIFAKNMIPIRMRHTLR